MSSFLQIIVNELVLRSPENSFKVIFEPGVESFQYGEPKISIQPTTSRQTKQGFIRKEGQIKTSSLLSDSVSQQTKDDLDESDKNLDTISNLLGNINNIGITMEKEIDRQIEEIDKLNEKTDEVNERIKKDNKKNR